VAVSFIGGVSASDIYRIQLGYDITEILLKVVLKIKKLKYC
jgi:hypothetical protein